MSTKYLFRFSDPAENYGLNRHNIDSQKISPIEVGNRVMKSPENMQYHQLFNDFQFYNSLLLLKGCVEVEISGLRVRHNDFCHGIQAIYLLTFEDGTSQKRSGPENFFSTGTYCWDTYGKIRDTWVYLKRGEYLTGVHINQDEILNGITFVTNEREVHCGGNGGYWKNSMSKNPSSMRIVAFSGTINGVTERIGYYAKDYSWKIARPYVLLRSLTIQNRASPVEFRANVLKRKRSSYEMIQGLIELPEEVFREIIRFIV
mmetsp:Transcript_58/g.60  ORF Transcript_58/g.60 Transcript_58/m.60 type:complete len:259 (+) Transcript_58:189-965(+)